MKNIWQIALITLLISSSIACKKSSSSIDPYQALTGNNIKSWGLSNKSTTVNGVTHNNALDTHDKEGRYIFNVVNNRYIYNTMTNYYPADTGKWALNGDKTILTISGSKTHDNIYAVETITNSYMRLREDHANFSIKTEYIVK